MHRLLILSRFNRFEQFSLICGTMVFIGGTGALMQSDSPVSKRRRFRQDLLQDASRLTTAAASSVGTSEHNEQDSLIYSLTRDIAKYYSIDVLPCSEDNAL